LIPRGSTNLDFETKISYLLLYEHIIAQMIILDAKDIAKNFDDYFPRREKE
jgi:hypothetical protein